MSISPPTVASHLPATGSKDLAAQTLPAFTVPEEQQVINSNELATEDHNQQVPGYQIDLRSHTLTNRDNSEPEDVDYGGYHKRLKLNSPNEHFTLDSFNHEDEVEENLLERSTLSDDENSFSSQSAHLDSFTLENMLPVSASSSFAKDDKLVLSKEANSSDTPLHGQAPKNTSSSHEAIDLDGRGAATPTHSVANTSDEEIQPCDSYADNIQVPVDGIVNLESLQDNTFTFSNSLSPPPSSVLSQRIAQDNLEHVTGSFSSDLSLEELEELHSHSSSDQQVPLSQDDEIANALALRYSERRQLQSCGAQMVPDRDIEE